MANYLITYNPTKFDWKTIEDDILELTDNNEFIGTWSCGLTKRIKAGDRLFMLRQGVEPRGIMASGWAISDVYQDEHWSDDTKQANYVDIRFDTILNPQVDKILLRSELDNGVLNDMHWDTQSSGTSIRGYIAFELEEIWREYSSDLPLVQEGEDKYEIEFREGRKRTVLATTYERNSVARDICLNKYGYKCIICDFDFEDIYGEIGKAFIHVHHIHPVAERQEEYNLNPIEDLRPVCPNCHAMLHKKKPCYSIEDIKLLVRRIP